jgi:acyl carrier protein
MAEKNPEELVPIELLIKILHDKIEPRNYSIEDINKDTFILKELGADSLHEYEITYAFDSEFGIDLEDEEWSDWRGYIVGTRPELDYTVGDLHEFLIEQKKKQ